jgi:RNA-directed DNA polymerase
VVDPAFLQVAWERVRSNKGARTAGVDGETARYIETVRGLEGFLEALRSSLKGRTFRPLPARQRAIPKAGGKVRYLGVATIRGSGGPSLLEAGVEPIFEADFLSCSYGFRPNRRAHDAVAEIHHFTSRSYGWIVEGDIKACFDEISHSALMDRVRQRVGDKRILALVKAFLKAGILDEDGDLNLDPPKRLCAPAALAGRKPLAVAGRRIQKVHDLGSRNGPLTRGPAGA